MFFFMAMDISKLQLKRTSERGTAHGALTDLGSVGRDLFERRYPYLSGGARTGLGHALRADRSEIGRAAIGGLLGSARRQGSEPRAWG